jgi:transcriptional regulator with XRE-family HTH domain
MTWAPGAVVTRRRLGGELRRLREQRGLKLEDVARSLECSPSKVSRLENGKGIPKSRDVRDMLDLYQIGEGAQRKQLLEWSRSGQQPMWWSAYADVLPAGYDTYVELEWDAARIHAYEPYAVHGLLQTPEYARAVLTSVWSRSRSLEDIDRLVEVRVKRQEALGVEHGLDFHCILDESTLYRVVGTSDVLRAQIERLIELAAANHIELRVLPFSAGLVAWQMGSFAKLEFANGVEQDLVHVETPDAATFLDSAEDVAVYDERLKALLGATLTERESLPLMERAVRRLTDD